MKNDEQRTIKILCVLGIIPVVWLALLIAPFVSGGLAEIVAQFPAAMENPFHIALCEDSQKTVLILHLIVFYLLCFLFCICAVSFRNVS